MPHPHHGGRYEVVDDLPPQHVEPAESAIPETAAPAAPHPPMSTPTPAETAPTPTRRPRKTLPR